MEVIEQCAGGWWGARWPLAAVSGCGAARDCARPVPPPGTPHGAPTHLRVQVWQVLPHRLPGLQHHRELAPKAGRLAGCGRTPEAAPALHLATRSLPACCPARSGAALASAWREACRCASSSWTVRDAGGCTCWVAACCCLPPAPAPPRHSMDGDAPCSPTTLTPHCSSCQCDARLKPRTTCLLMWWSACSTRWVQAAGHQLARALRWPAGPRPPPSAAPTVRAAGRCPPPCLRPPGGARVAV